MKELSKEIIEKNEFVGVFNTYLNTVFKDIKDTKFVSEKIHLHKEFIFWEMVEEIAKTHKKSYENKI